MDKGTLGSAGIAVSNLCFGTGTDGWAGKSDQTALGLDGLADLLAYAYDRGVSFWDSADQYGSHPHVARACKVVGRENVMAGTDCGLGNRVGHPTIVWAKFESMVEGARRATAQLWK